MQHFFNHICRDLSLRMFCCIPDSQVRAASCGKSLSAPTSKASFPTRHWAFSV